MQTLIHADIFFFITSIVVVILAIFAIVILFYVLRIVRSVDHIVDNIKKESDSVAADIEMLRTNIKEKGTHLFSFLVTASKFLLGRNVKERSRAKKEKED